MASIQVKRLIGKIDTLTDEELSTELDRLSSQEQEEFESKVLSMNQKALEESKKLRERASRLHGIRK